MEKDYMNKFWTDNKEKIITVITGGALLIGFIVIIALISGTIMKVFGFEYNSIGGLILFFIAATVLSYPMNLMAVALPKSLLKMEKITGKQALFIYLILDTVATGFGMIILDHLMISVSATKVSIIVISVLLAVFGKEDFSKVEQ